MSPDTESHVSGLAAARRELPSLFPYLRRYKWGLFWGCAAVLITAASANVVPLLVSGAMRHISSESSAMKLRGPLFTFESMLANSIGMTGVLPVVWELQRPAVDALSQEHFRESSRLHLYFLGILGFSLFSAVFRFYQRWVLIGVSRKIEYDLRNALFAHLLRLPPAYFDRMTTGDIIARATNDLNQVRAMLGPGLMYPVNALFTMAFALAGMIYLSPTLAMVALGPPILMAVGTNRLARVVHDRFLEVQEQYSKISTRVQENLAGIRVVKAYGMEDREVDAIRDLNQDYLNKNLRYFKAEGVLYPFFGFSHNLGRFVVLGVAGVLLLSPTSNFAVGDFAAFLLYLNMLLFPMISIGWVLNVIQRGVASLGRINEVMNEVPTIRDPDQPVDRKPERGEIELRNVSFGYTPDRLVLQGISLIIPAGTTVGIIGATGSGKSTLAHLIPRFHDPSEGEILIDGVPIQQYRLSDLRGEIGLVSQDHFLFSTSVKNNIGFGMSPEEFGADGAIEEASRLAALHENVVEFPQGYETTLGERGITLSGGQRQRASLARAIAIDPSILILDDALSAVDTHTEEQILQGLRSVTRDRTTILISHRISTVQEADWTIVLEDGRIAEQGTHEDLLRLEGIYAEINQHQLLEAQLEELSA